MKKRIILFSIFFSLISISVTFFINYQVAQAYLRVDSKTQALFGLIETLSYGYQYYVVLLGIIALILAIIEKKKIDGNYKKIIAIILSLVAISLVFSRTWRLFV